MFSFLVKKRLRSELQFPIFLFVICCGNISKICMKYSKYDAFLAFYWLKINGNASAMWLKIYLDIDGSYMIMRMESNLARAKR